METKERHADSAGFFCGSRIVRLSFSEITHVVDAAGYTTIYTGTGKFRTISSLSEVYSRLPGKDFFRLGRNYIIGLQHVEKIGSVLVVAGFNIPLTYYFRNRLLAALEKSMPGITYS